MAARTMALEFPSRPRRRVTDLARERIWMSRCGRYKVVEARSLFGAVPTVFYAEVLAEGGCGGKCCWDVISRHRRKEPALAACRRLAAERMRAEG